MATAILINLAMIATTGIFTLIALGPDSLLEGGCLGKRSGSCFESHGSAAVWAVSGSLTIFFLGLKEAEDAEHANDKGRPPDIRGGNRGP